MSGTQDVPSPAMNSGQVMRDAITCPQARACLVSRRVRLRGSLSMSLAATKAAARMSGQRPSLSSAARPRLLDG